MTVCVWLQTHFCELTSTELDPLAQNRIDFVHFVWTCSPLCDSSPKTRKCAEFRNLSVCLYCRQPSSSFEKSVQFKANFDYILFNFFLWDLNLKNLFWNDLNAAARLFKAGNKRWADDTLSLFKLYIQTRADYKMLFLTFKLLSKQDLSGYYCLGAIFSKCSL